MAAGHQAAHRAARRREVWRVQIGHPLSAMETRRDSIDQAEERAFKELAELTLAFSDDELRQLIKAGVYKELKNNG